MWHGARGPLSAYARFFAKDGHGMRSAYASFFGKDSVSSASRLSPTPQQLCLTIVCIVEPHKMARGMLLASCSLSEFHHSRTMERTTPLVFEPVSSPTIFIGRGPIFCASFIYKAPIQRSHTKPSIQRHLLIKCSSERGTAHACRLARCARILS